MFQRWPLALLLTAAALSGPASQAQTAAPAKRADPLDAKTPVPPAVHVSPLRAYRPAGDTAVGSWKDANDTVTRIGGWRTYLREATQAEPAPAPAAPAASAPAARPAPAPAQRGHGHHGPR